MRIVTGVPLLIMLLLSPAVMAQDGGVEDKTPLQRGLMYGPEDEVEGLGEERPPGPPRYGRKKMYGKKGMMGPGGREAGLQFKQFRQEVKILGQEIRENKMMIRSLEEEFETMEPGIPRAEVRKKLNEYRLREAELQMDLARKRVDFTRRARDLAQERYDQARLGLERVRAKIKKKYPDLTNQMESEMDHPGNPGPNPDY